MKKNKNRDFLLNNENLYYNVIYLAWPIVVQSLLQVSIGTIDIKMVSSLGVDAISAVGTGRNIIMLLMVLVMAVSTGTIAMISRFTGMNDSKSASKSAGQGFILSIAASAFMIPVGLLTKEWVLHLLGVNESVFILAKQYMVIFFFSISFFLLNFMAKSIFQGAGDTKTPLMIDIIMNLVNVLGNFIFIFGFWIIPPLGVQGAALMGILALIFIIFSTPFIEFFLDEYNADVVSIGKSFLIIIGLSEPLHGVTISLSRTMQGAGYTKYPFIITFVSWLVIRIPLAYILAFVFNLQSTGVWIAISFTTILSAILSYLVFRRGKWKHVQIHKVNNKKPM
ncbi:MAG: MATE family efflux transporter [Bacillota bacterium]|nr:MATE family efflux transporter [Bacillota bacterium]